MVPELYEKFQDWEGAWVTAQDWLWRRDVPAPACDRCGALLEFDGLDTLANVTLTLPLLDFTSPVVHILQQCPAASA